MKKVITLTALSFLISFPTSSCDITGLLNGVMSDFGTTISGETDTKATSKAYTQGDLSVKDEFYTQMSNSVSKTSGALLQSILSVNTLLYTDISVTDLDTFKRRKSEADKALALLETYAKETETIITQAESNSLSQKSFKTKDSSLNPEDVLVTVASGPANKQIKTLMQKYQVNAKQAKDILDKAMEGLISTYNKEADFYDKATRTATLVKEGAALTLTVAGAVVTAGGVTGTMALGEAAITVITGADGIIKVTKAGTELILGKDVKLPDGTVSTIATGLSDVSEIISFTSLKKWTETPDRISNVVNIVLKTNDALQDGQLNLGAHTFEISKKNIKIIDFISNDAPTTLPGTYKIAGEKVEVKNLPESLKNIIEKLAPENILDSIKTILAAIPTATPSVSPSPTLSASPSASPSVKPSASVPPVNTSGMSRLRANFRAYDLGTSFIKMSSGFSTPSIGATNYMGDETYSPLTWNGGSFNVTFNSTSSSVTRIPGMELTITLKGSVDLSKNILTSITISNEQKLDGKLMSKTGFSAKNVPLTPRDGYLECDIIGKDVQKYITLADIDAGGTVSSVNWDNAELMITFQK